MKDKIQKNFKKIHLNNNSNLINNLSKNKGYKNNIFENKNNNYDDEYKLAEEYFEKNKLIDNQEKAKEKKKQLNIELKKLKDGKWKENRTKNRRNNFNK